MLDIGTQNVTLCMGVREYAQSSKKKEFNRNLYLESSKQKNRPSPRLPHAPYNREGVSALRQT